MKRAGLHVRLLIAAFALIAAVTLTLDIVVVHITKQFMHKRFKDRITFLAKYLALNSEVGVLINDKSGLNSLAHNLLGEEDVVRVIIMDNQSNHLVDLKRSVRTKLSMVETPVLFKQANDENILFNSEGMIRRNPFDQKEITIEEVIGKVRIYFSTQGIDQLFIKITKQFIWISAVLAMLGGLVFYLISRAVGKELTQLSVTAQHIGLGATELRSPLGKLPETRAVALSFNTMLDSLEKSREAFERVNREMSRQKTLAEVGKFSLMVAHEVKNPLGIIKSSLDMLKPELPDASNNIMVIYIEDEIQRLNQLIEDFLLFARPVKPSLNAVNLNDTLNEVTQRFKLLYSESPITIEADVPEEPCETHADRDLISRGVSNMIKNAFEAMNGEGEIKISAIHSDGWWTATIEDQGEGVPSDLLHRIFEPFFTTRSKGTGLGLAFTEQVIKAHGGILTAENKDEGGAVFTIKLPIKGAPQATLGGAPSELEDRFA